METTWVTPRTTTKFPKLARVFTLFKIAVNILIVQFVEIGVHTLPIHKIIKKHDLELSMEGLDEDYVAKQELSFRVLIAAFTLRCFCYAGDVAVVVLLYLGYKKKSYILLKSCFWLSFAMFDIFLGSTLFEFYEKRPPFEYLLYNIALIVWRFIALKVIYDGVKEAKAFQQLSTAIHDYAEQAAGGEGEKELVATGNGVAAVLDEAKLEEMKEETKDDEKIELDVIIVQKDDADNNEAKATATTTGNGTTGTEK